MELSPPFTYESVLVRKKPLFHMVGESAGAVCIHSFRRPGLPPYASYELSAHGERETWHRTALLRALLLVVVCDDNEK